MSIGAVNHSTLRFYYNLVNILDGVPIPGFPNGQPVPLSTFNDAGACVLYLIDSFVDPITGKPAGKKLGPFTATLDNTVLNQMWAVHSVDDNYTGLYDATSNPSGWKKVGDVWLPKTWYFQLQAPKGGTGTYYSSPLSPFPISPVIPTDVGN